MAVWNRDLIVQKIDKVLGDTKQILTALSGGTGAVKSVQRGTARFTGVMTAKGYHNGATADDPLIINIDTVKRNKCAVFINGYAFRDDVGRTYPVSVKSITENQIQFTVANKRIMSDDFDGSEELYEDMSIKEIGETVFSKEYFDWQIIEFY